MRTRAVELDDGRDIVHEFPILPPLADAVVAMVAIVRAVYCNHVRLLGIKTLLNYGAKPVDGDGVTTLRGVYGRTKFEHLAVHLVNLGASPEAYIRAQFDMYEKDGKGHPFPSVNMLTSDWALGNWVRYSRNRPQSLVWQLKSDQTQIGVNVMPMIVNLGWGEREAIEYVLGDMNGCVITPLTRYCTAYAHGIERVANESFRSALFQYVFEKKYYDNILGSGIPVSLSEAARTVRRSMGLY